MRKVVFLNHVSVDGFVAGPKGEMDWIQIPPGLFEWGSTLTDQADAALYGRITYGMMQHYWPTAGSKPNASAHDKSHSAWYNRVTKYVVSKTMDDPTDGKTVVIRSKVEETIRTLKQQPGKNIQMYGSPSVVQALIEADLVDEFYLTVNPILLGKGIPLFKGLSHRTNLVLVESTLFSGGVMLLHYARKA